MSRFGIDVSKWQGNFSFDKAIKEGVSFAILRLAYGKTLDTRFNAFYMQCKNLKLDIGGYVYATDKSVVDAITTAEWVYNNVLVNRQFEYPIYYDVEGSMLNLDKNKLTEIIIAFLETLESKGIFAGVYANSATFNNHVDDKQLAPYTHWIARWSKTKPELNSGNKTHMWQFGGETNAIRTNKIAGVICDQDYCYVDFPRVIKRAGLNGFEK